VLGGRNRSSTVTGPAGRPVHAAWRLDAGGVAVVESASACGLVLAGGPEGNDAVGATTRGVGELIADAVEAGARRVVVGIGGTATSDGGRGALAALAERRLNLRRAGVRIEVCCDVRTPFTLAARVFGPQKGATDPQVALLTDRLVAHCDRLRGRTGIDLDDMPGTGAGGGLAGGLASASAVLVDGFEAVASHVGLDQALAGADLVVTGESRLDVTSLDGKVVGAVLAHARRARVPVLVVAGQVTADARLGVEADGRALVVDLSARHGLTRAHDEVAALIRSAVAARDRDRPGHGGSLATRAEPGRG
jgi:glycerate kinase